MVYSAEKEKEGARMRILGIDPGLAIVGWGVIEKRGFHTIPVACGAIRTPAHTRVEARLLSIFRDMRELIERYHPEEMAIEELFFTNNITTGISVAEARGVILAAAAEAGVPISEYTPPQVKQAVVGYGKADKHQVISMVTSILKLPSPPKPDDTADALAVAICHAQCVSSRISPYFNN